MTSLLLPSASRPNLLRSLLAPPPTARTSTLFSSLSLGLPRPAASPAALLPSTSSSPSITGLAHSLLQDLWELFPSVLRAAPKKRTTHSKKRQRAHNKQLKDTEAIVACKACGMPKRQANICQTCKAAITRDLKNQKRVLSLFEQDAISRGVENPFAQEAKRANEGQVIRGYRADGGFGEKIEKP